MPSPEDATLWAQHGCDNRLEYVRWVVIAALIKKDREDREQRAQLTNGLTTGELTKTLLVADGAFSGSLKDFARQVRSEAGLQRQEVRAALATLLLDEMVQNPETGRHPDVWRLTPKSLDRIRSGDPRTAEWNLTREERGRRMLGMKSSV